MPFLYYTEFKTPYTVISSTYLQTSSSSFLSDPIITPTPTPKGK